MGQRLCLTTYGAGERCYNIYVHWGGYTLYGLETARNLIELTTNYCEEKYKLDWKKMTKYDYIEALLMNDVGMRIYWFNQEFEEDKNYPEISKLCDDFIKKDFLRRYPASEAEFVELKKKIFDDANLKSFKQKEFNLKEKTFFELFRSITDENGDDIGLLADYFRSLYDSENKHLDEMMTELFSICTDANRNDGLIQITENGMNNNAAASDGYFLDINFDERIVTDNISCADTLETNDFREYIADNFDYIEIRSIIVCGNETIAETESDHKYKFRNIYVGTNEGDGGPNESPEDYYEISFEDLYPTINMYDNMERQECYAMRFLPESAKTDPTKAFENYGVFHLVA